MARKTAEVPIAPVETIRHRLQMNLTEFSEALGFGTSAYGDMVRRGTVTKTVHLAAEALMRRQAPGAENELAFVTRIVKGVPLVTFLDEAQTMVLNDRRYLLVPIEAPRRSAPIQQPSPHAGNGAAAPSSAELPV